MKSYGHFLSEPNIFKNDLTNFVAFPKTMWHMLASKLKYKKLKNKYKTMNS